MNRDLSEKQLILLKAIKKFIDKKGYSPSVRELCKMTKKKSPATIKAMLDILKDKGYVDFKHNKNRTLRVIKEVE